MGCGFPNDLACVIHNADAGLLDRHVQSSKMVHAALHHATTKGNNPTTAAFSLAVSPSNIAVVATGAFEGSCVGGLYFIT